MGDPSQIHHSFHEPTASPLFISSANWRLPDQDPEQEILTEFLRHWDGAVVRIWRDRLPWRSSVSMMLVDKRCMLREWQVISAASAREKQLNSAIRWRQIRPQSTATGPLATLMTSAGRVQSADTTYPTAFLQSRLETFFLICVMFTSTEEVMFSLSLFASSFVCLLAGLRKIRLNWFSQNSVDSWQHVGHGRTHQILVVMRITLRWGQS